MKNNDLVSVIMPSYNSEAYIKISIESVLNQTYQNLELVVVDDCSNDKTVEIIKSFKDQRIRLFVNEKNSGAAISRNKALREAKGKWIAFLDSDDEWMTNKLEEQINFMETNSYPFSYTDYVRYEGNNKKRLITAPNKMTFRKIKRYCYIATLTIMYDAEKIGLIQIGDIKKNNDYAMWLKALKNVTGYRLKKCLSIYNRHTGSISSGSKLKLIKWHYYLFRNECRYSKFHSLFLTLGNLWHGFWKQILFSRKYKDEGH